MITTIRGSENTLQFTGEHHWSPITLISSRCCILLVAGIRPSIGTALRVWDWWIMSASCETSWIGTVVWMVWWSIARKHKHEALLDIGKVRTFFLNNGLDDMMYVVVNRLMYSNAFINDGALPIKVRLLRCQRFYVVHLTDSVRVSWCWWIWLSNNVLSSRLFTWTSRTLVTGWIYTLMSQPLKRIILNHTKSRICSVRLSEAMTGWMWCWMWWTMMD